MNACDLERLPLLIYPGELSEDELHELRVHLTLCERCEQVHAELEAVAAQLDLVPEPQLSASERRRLLAEVATATGVEDAGVRRALDLVGLDFSGVEFDLEDDDLRASLRERVLSRVGLAGTDEDLSSLESELGAALDLVATPALSEDARAGLRDGVLARVGLAPALQLEHEEAALGAALSLLEAPVLSEDARASVREGVLARVGLAAQHAEEAPADLAAALDGVAAPALSEDERAGLRDAVLERAGLSATAPLEHQEAEFAAALDGVTAPTLSEDERARLREGVLARVGLGATASSEPAESELEKALDLVPAPTLSASERTQLEGEVAAHTAPAAAPAPQGTLLRFPRWILAAAAALLLSGTVALYYAGSKGSPGDMTGLAFLEAEKLVRTADEIGDEAKAAHLVASARERMEQVVLTQGADPEVQRRAKRELMALDALSLRSEPGGLHEGIAPEPLRRSPESFLRPKRVVLERYPESLAAHFVLRRYIDLAAQRETPVASPVLPSDAEIASVVSSSLEADLGALREQDAAVFAVDLADLEKHFGAPSLVRTIRHALLIQRGLHTARRGEVAAARALYLQVQEEDAEARQLDPKKAESRAAEVARELAADLPH